MGLTSAAKREGLGRPLCVVSPGVPRGSRDSKARTARRPTPTLRSSRTKRSAWCSTGRARSSTSSANSESVPLTLVSATGCRAWVVDPSSFNSSTRWPPPQIPRRPPQVIRRVFARRPYGRSTSGSTPSCSARCTTAVRRVEARHPERTEPRRRAQGGCKADPGRDRPTPHPPGSTRRTGTAPPGRFPGASAESPAPRR